MLDLLAVRKPIKTNLRCMHPLTHIAASVWAVLQPGKFCGFESAKMVNICEPNVPKRRNFEGVMYADISVFHCSWNEISANSNWFKLYEPGLSWSMEIEEGEAQGDRQAKLGKKPASDLVDWTLYAY